MPTPIHNKNNSNAYGERTTPYESKKITIIHYKLSGNQSLSRRVLEKTQINNDDSRNLLTSAELVGAGVGGFFGMLGGIFFFGLADGYLATSDNHPQKRPYLCLTSLTAGTAIGIRVGLNITACVRNCIFGQEKIFKPDCDVLTV